jgi:hypothetical protein
MSFYGSSRHLQLTGNFGVVTALQEQFNDLLFARPQPNGLFLHRFPPEIDFSRPKLGRTRILL